MADARAIIIRFAATATAKNEGTQKTSPPLSQPPAKMSANSGKLFVAARAIHAWRRTADAQTQHKSPDKRVARTSSHGRRYTVRHAGPSPTLNVTLPCRACL